ncbi:MAG: flagellar hook-length control protein FliK [Candidatus Saganbacteria bacterium]|nr:flagellar hook-length control protein FliK [Candidatus Saganbacteria bacterium]
MTIQLPALESSDPRLLTDSCKPTAADSSFAEKLETEKERLGLLFSPLSQFASFFTSPLELTWAQDQNEPEVSNQERGERSKNDLPSSRPAHTNPAPEEAAGSLFARMRTTAPAQTLSRQFLQELLTKTDLLVPNLAAQPRLNQAFQAGELKPGYDLQALIDQIVKQAGLVRSKDRAELSLTLSQEELGDIFLKLTSVAGRVSVLITASAEARRSFEAQKPALERALKKANIPLDRVVIEEVKTC